VRCCIINILCVYVVQGAQIVQLISDYREMLARRRRTSSTTVTADDAESAPDVSFSVARRQQRPRSPGASRRPRLTHGASYAASAVPASRRRPGAGHRRPQSPTSSPEPDAPPQPPPATTSAGHEAEADPGGVRGGKTPEFKYKRVKDSVRQPQKRGHLQLAGRKSDAHQEGIFD